MRLTGYKKFSHLQGFHMDNGSHKNWSHTDQANLVNGLVLYLLKYKFILET